MNRTEPMLPSLLGPEQREVQATRAERRRNTVVPGVYRVPEDRKQTEPMPALTADDEDRKKTAPAKPW